MRKLYWPMFLGAAAGCLVAWLLPNLGKTGLEKGVADAAISLGATQPPYLQNGAIGAAVGALLGFLMGKVK